ncbi:MAG: PAS domain S-box protein [Deltaproteobacteria bacterium]|nr:PAS domain S-box protein [Deltaproteobacteria bacterium]
MRGDIISLSGTLTEYVIYTRKSLLIRTEDLEDYNQRFPGLSITFQTGFRSLMSIPLISKDKVIGILHFQSVETNAYSQEELRLAEKVGYEITSAIANSQLFAEHKRTEEALRYSEKRFKDLYDEAPMGYHQCDTEGRIISVNQRETEMLGYTAEEMVGEHVWMFLVDQEDSRESIMAKIAGDMPPSKGLERTYRRKDGSLISVLIVDAVIRDNDGRIAGIRTSMQDITELKQADKEKEELQDQLRRAQKMESLGTLYTKKVMGRSGTGLGMAVVWGTVKDHKGYIDVQSAKGKRTTFTLYFPITRKELIKDMPVSSIEEYRGRGECILVVDDIKDQREIATALLSQLGYSVATVSSGEEAVEYMINKPVDLMVLDMIMDPGMDGLDTYKRIIELHPRQKAIIASGFSETDRVKEAQSLGVGQYIKKPYTLEKIGTAVRRELDK